MLSANSVCATEELFDTAAMSRRHSARLLLGSLTWRYMLVACCAASGFTGCKPQDQVDRERSERAAAAAIENAPPQRAAQKAEVGVGKQGDSLDDVSENSPGGIIAAPVKAYFRTKERVVFEIQIPQMMNLYKALHGKAPQSHEAFMKEIEANRIPLPKLPEGMEYRYRVDSEELWVEPIGSSS